MIVKILGLKKMANSRMGNPKFRVRMTGGQEYTTPTDAGWAYAIHRGMVGKEANITVSGKRLLSLEILK